MMKQLETYVESLVTLGSERLAMLALRSALAVARRPALCARHRRLLRAGPHRCSGQTIVRAPPRLCFGLTQRDSSSSTRRKLGAQICSRSSAMVPRDSRVRNGTCQRSASCSARPWSLDLGADCRLKAYSEELLLQLLTITPRRLSWYAGQRLQERSFGFGSCVWIARTLRIGSRGEQDATPLFE